MTGFIADHPEIEIASSVVSMPESVRAQFYNLFNGARGAFLQERFPEHLDKSAVLLGRYRKAEEKLQGLMSLEGAPTASELERFLQDPKGTFARELFDPLFDLLKGKESVETFEKKASDKVEALAPAVFRGGYEKWAILSLVDLLEAEKAFRVNVRNLHAGERTKSTAHAPFEEVPAPQESASFLFSQSRNAIFAVPDLIVRSCRLNRFVGIRSEFREGLHHAWNASQEREWHSVDTELLILLQSGPTLVYMAERPESVALVADVEKCARPDLVLWCRDTSVRTQRESLERAAQVDRRLKPLKGSYMVASDPWPESCGSEQTAGIRLLTVGYDIDRLRPVVDALAATT